MIGILDRLAAFFFGDGDRDNEEAEDTTFVPSTLDWSVRFAHGGGSSEAETEMVRMEENARRLGEEQEN